MHFFFFLFSNKNGSNSSIPLLVVDNYHRMGGENANAFVKIERKKIPNKRNENIRKLVNDGNILLNFIH